MTRKVYSIFLKTVTVISTLVFAFVNFENMTLNLSVRLFVDSTKSLNGKYQYWLEDIYGEEKGCEIIFAIEGFTIWMIEHHINQILFVVISLMMLLCIWIDKKQGKKMNKILKVYFIICFILMFFATFIAGPQYIDLIYGD